jgi:hypothetical protein
VVVRGRRVVGESHLKLLLEQQGRTLAAIGFGMSDQPVDAGDRLDILFSPMVSTWQGATTLELRLLDVRHSVEGQGGAASVSDLSNGKLP